MRPTAEERAERLLERVLQALVVSGGWLPLSALRVLAIGGDSATSAELLAALAILKDAGLVTSKRVRHVVGHFGRKRGCVMYRAVGTALSAERREDGNVATLVLDPADLGALRALIDDHLNRARDVTRSDRAEELRWIRLGALIGAELDAANDEAL
jgi:hypothetical protein